MKILNHELQMSNLTKIRKRRQNPRFDIRHL